MHSQKTQKRTSDALALVEGLSGKSQQMADLVEQEQANLDIARKIYELRSKAKLSQTELARKVGTTQSVISRLEDADYDGHSLEMLRRIAQALGQEVRVLMEPPFEDLTVRLAFREVLRRLRISRDYDTEEAARRLHIPPNE